MRTLMMKKKKMMTQFRATAKTIYQNQDINSYNQVQGFCCTTSLQECTTEWMVRADYLRTAASSGMFINMADEVLSFCTAMSDYLSKDEITNIVLAFKEMDLKPCAQPPDDFKTWMEDYKDTDDDLWNVYLPRISAFSGDAKTSKNNADADGLSRLPGIHTEPDNISEESVKAICSLVQPVAYIESLSHQPDALDNIPDMLKEHQINIRDEQMNDSIIRY
ncbi:unnamed protein product [Mytilus coruscus]|uniref:Uncharacterized protein n=1 Tax=Mytilus coruscus TaxID=42192 RepID=A0A6J8CWN3_MYTCO|nr:unnamed protein product [Mytilus coruscus]